MMSMNPQPQISIDEVKDEVAFLESQVHLHNISLRSTEGLGLLIDRSNAYVSNTARTNENLRATHTLLALCGLLRELERRSIDFSTPFSKMIYGDYDFGLPSLQNGSYKDFELELFIAAKCAAGELTTEIPVDDDNNDVICEGLEIQCNHPNGLTNLKEKVKKFEKRLNKSGSFGVLAIGLEDAFNYDTTISTAETSYQAWLNGRRKKIEEDVGWVMNHALPNKHHVIGVITSVTFYLNKTGTMNDVRLSREGNGVLCTRPYRADIVEDHYNRVRKVLARFNPNPAVLVFDGTKLISTNGKPA